MKGSLPLIIVHSQGRPAFRHSSFLMRAGARAAQPMFEAASRSRRANPSPPKSEPDGRRAVVADSPGRPPLILNS